MQTITINGKEHDLEKEMSISALLDSLGIQRQGTAVSINSKIVQRDLHDERTISDGDSVEIIRAIGGG